MENDFRINVYFSNDGEEIEKILANYLGNLLDKRNIDFIKHREEEKCLKR